jgi:DegV family protein with EDD domain
MAIKLITDSTSDLPPELAQQWDITVIPCYVNFDDRSYQDGVNIDPDEFFRLLSTSPRLPTTSQPTPNDFFEVYKGLADQGHDIVSVHLSAKFSGTLNSAIQAREQLLSSQSGNPARVEVIDSYTASVGLGLIVLEVARVIRDGSSYEQVVEAARSSIARTQSYFILDTLEYLQKGGRIGKASAFLGSILKIKPILTIREGEVHPVERARSLDRGLQRLVSITQEASPLKRLGVVHSATDSEAESLKSRLGSLLPEGEIMVTRFGPVLGTYVGPGAMGIAMMT